MTTVPTLFLYNRLIFRNTISVVYSLELRKIKNEFLPYIMVSHYTSRTVFVEVNTPVFKMQQYFPTTRNGLIVYGFETSLYPHSFCNHLYDFNDICNFMDFCGLHLRPFIIEQLFTIKINKRTKECSLLYPFFTSNNYN